LKTVLNLFLLTLSLSTVYGQDELIYSVKSSLPAIIDSPAYVDALNRIGMLSSEQSADTTLVYANKARDIARRIDYARGVADATNNLGIFFDISGSSELALHYYSDAYNLYNRLKDTSNVAQTLMNLAMVYNTNGNDNKAIALYNEAMHLASSLSQDSILSLVIYNFLLQYPKSFAPDSVDFNIARASRIAEKYHDIRSLLAIGQLKANRYLQAGRRDTAIRILQESIAGAMREKLYFMSLDILGELGDLYSETDSTKAVAYYQQAMDITHQKNYLSYDLDLTNKLLDFYTAHDDRTRMLLYSNTLARLYRNKQLQDNRFGIDYISYGLKDQQLQAIRERSSYEHTLLWLESIGFLLIVAISLILWRNAKKSKRTNAILQEQYKTLINTSAALETSNRNYARLIRVVAHDLRNPIGAISSIAGIKADDSAIPDKEKEWIRLIDTSGKRCLQLIAELLQTDFSSSEKTLHKEPVDPNTLLLQTALLLAYRASEKRQRLIAADSNLPLIQADKEKLARVLDNLVVNAIKFSPEDTTIELRAETRPKELILSVHDNGVGIPKDMATLLFEPFINSVRRKGTAGEQSFGLGLYICRQIVEAHGGRIWFESEPGQGSVFFIALPIS
jgi:signal transduction histidine kinase